MGIDVDVDGYTGAFGHLNGAHALTVGLPDLVAHSITVGGVPRGSAYERTLRRASIASQVRSSMAVDARGRIVATNLFENTETTEKSAISFRLGMGFAALTASRVLGVHSTSHIRTTGRRADLVGRDSSWGVHVIEAKGRWRGVPQAVSSGKAQARATRLAHTVDTRSVIVADFRQIPVAVTMRDPPPDETLYIDLDQVFRDFYAPVPELLQVVPAAATGRPEIDDHATGAWLPGSDVWLGVDRRILAAFEMSAQRRRSLWPEIAEAITPISEADYARTGDGYVLLTSDRILEPNARID